MKYPPHILFIYSIHRISLFAYTVHIQHTLFFSNLYPSWFPIQPSSNLNAKNAKCNIIKDKRWISLNYSQLLKETKWLVSTQDSPHYWAAPNLPKKTLTTFSHTLKLSLSCCHILNCAQAVCKKWSSWHSVVERQPATESSKTFLLASSSVRVASSKSQKPLMVTSEQG